jgi:hypothetical protein
MNASSPFQKTSKERLAHQYSSLNGLTRRLELAIGYPTSLLQQEAIRSSADQANVPCKPLGKKLPQLPPMWSLLHHADSTLMAQQSRRNLLSIYFLPRHQCGQLTQIPSWCVQGRASLMALKRLLQCSTTMLLTATYYAESVKDFSLRL